MNRRPQFTPEQIDWICFQIGDWYCAWKDNILCAHGGHRLGFAKELLKEKICGDGSIEKYYGSYKINFYRLDNSEWSIIIKHIRLGFTMQATRDTYENFAEAFKDAKELIDLLEDGSDADESN